MRRTWASVILFETTDGPVQKQGMFGGRYCDKVSKKMRFELAEDQFEHGILAVIRRNKSTHSTSLQLPGWAAMIFASQVPSRAPDYF